MYLQAQQTLAAALQATLRTLYNLDLAQFAIEQPPEMRFGEYALPVALKLAKELRKAPRKIAEEIVAGLGTVPGFAGFEVAGAGYINARLDRSAAVRILAEGTPELIERTPQHALVEHTSINPNKAAHVGHLRNAILGDTFVRLLRATGDQVSVQNYIDNTGVQVADIVVGLEHLLGLSLGDVEQWIAGLAERIDFACWDLYARTSQWYTAGSPEENAARKQLRLDTLHRLEQGNNPTAAIAERVATLIVRRHLETMLRLGITYDLLPRESEILHLHFWDAAFVQLKETGVLRLETAGKNTGCWIMRRANTEGVAEGETDEEAKVIVRSNGTVTYVGKDIAYHLWKFGLLGKDFGYNPFFRYPSDSGHPTCWITAEHGEAEHPHFGGADAIYNVIDSRQSDPQSNVIEALRGMGFAAQAERYTHFSYEMVALTPRCALELGYEVAEADRARAYIEVSGRKGFGVKADDLIDRLVAATRAEVDERNPELSEVNRAQTAQQIAVGALRYFMLKFTRNTVIAFDFKDALSFEGETGPYQQYAVVRTRSIFRKANASPAAVLAEAATLDLAAHLDGEAGDSIWQVWLRAAKTGLVLEQCRDTAEPAHLARHCFLLAQEFSAFYRKHHILTEEDPARKTLLLATAAIAEQALVRSLAILGIEAPAVM
ncbi:arginine--tRNA ligase [Acidipila sp. EB88]|uniref:arginine--tRNA ligase n=1 Tax=Acidipila sp. EB88 TaxID=2305226 RepID=UPI000F60395E|nr:arginine--tRNA ligase [Acidipila sp. EB88]RRA47377.1 arginine--tRNA ligase [Acidipila sp. EB88]